MNLRPPTHRFGPWLALAGLIAAAASADNIRIVSVSPPSGNFPMLPSLAEAVVEYEVTSSPWARIAVEAIPHVVPGPGQTAPGASFVPCWVPKGKGTKTMQFSLNCGENCVPSGPVTAVHAMLHASAACQTPPQQLLAEHTLPAQYSYACPGAPVPLPDITSRGGIKLGERFVRWGGSVQLSEAESSRVANGRCGFDARYEMVNAGAAATSPAFSNRLTLDTKAAVIATNTGLALAKSEAKTLTAQLPLTPGTHVLSLVLDADNQVAESNEKNNAFRVTYTLAGTCAHPVLQH